MDNRIIPLGMGGLLVSDRFPSAVRLAVAYAPKSLCVFTIDEMLRQGEPEHKVLDLIHSSCRHHIRQHALERFGPDHPQAK